jgi:multiple sugar transport system substrate-binding protein
MSRSRLKLFPLIGIFVLAACQTVQPIVPGTPTPASAPHETGTAATLPPVASPTAAPSPTPEIPVELTVTPEDLKGLELGFWHPLAGKAAETLEAQVRLFNLSNPWDLHVTLRAAGSPGLLEDAVSSAGEEGPPDIVLAPSDLLAAWDAQDQRLADLSLYLESETWGMAVAEREGYDSRYWNQDRVGEKQLGLPALRTALGLMYNLTFADELGFKAPPTTPQEFSTQACASSIENNRYLPRYGTAGWMLDTRPLSALSWLSAFGAEVEPQGQDPAWHFDQPEARQALAFLHEMQAQGCVWIPKYPTAQTYFSGRLAFFYNASLQDLASQRGAMTVAKNQDQWTLIPFPASDGKGFVYADGYSYAVMRFPEQADPARQMGSWLFIRWMSAQERLTALGEVWPSLPVRNDVRAALAEKEGSFPWTVILPLAEAARPAPVQPSWRVVRRPLEDAFWQTFNLAGDGQLKTILPMLDSMAGDLLKDN